MSENKYTRKDRSCMEYFVSREKKVTSGQSNIIILCACVSISVLRCEYVCLHIHACVCMWACVFTIITCMCVNMSVGYMNEFVYVTKGNTFKTC